MSAADEHSDRADDDTVMSVIQEEGHKAHEDTAKKPGVPHKMSGRLEEQRNRSRKFLRGGLNG